jgi:hypothetical protein
VNLVAERPLIPGLDDNWTQIIGQMMNVCNSNKGQRGHDMSSYTAVFGQSYYPALKCPLKMMWQCEMISQCLHISHDEKLEKSHVMENVLMSSDEDL